MKTLPILSNRLPQCGSFFGLLIATVLLAAPMAAQRTKTPMEEAVDFRAQVAQQVINGERNAASAIAHLKGSKAASSFSLEGDGALGLAAVDIGKRLRAAGDSANAQHFFEEAQKALIKAARDKRLETEKRVILLQTLVTIQATHLNDPVSARANWDLAMELAPNTPDLERLYARLSARHRDEFPYREPEPAFGNGEGDR